MWSARRKRYSKRRRQESEPTSSRTQGGAVEEAPGLSCEVPEVVGPSAGSAGKRGSKGPWRGRGGHELVKGGSARGAASWAARAAEITRGPGTGVSRVGAGAARTAGPRGVGEGLPGLAAKELEVRGKLAERARRREATVEVGDED